jgi:hypothetical protein
VHCLVMRSSSVRSHPQNVGTGLIITRVSVRNSQLCYLNLHKLVITESREHRWADRRQRSHRIEGGRPAAVCQAKGIVLVEWGISECEFGVRKRHRASNEGKYHPALVCSLTALACPICSELFKCLVQDARFVHHQSSFCSWNSDVFIAT